MKNHAKVRLFLLTKKTFFINHALMYFKNVTYIHIIDEWHEF
jgi:hypothetical protein